MSLKGNLQDFTITQLLNLINLSHKTGTLIVKGPDAAASLYFMEGKLAHAQIANEDNSLVGILHKTNQLSSDQYTGIKRHINGMTDKELGLLLVNANYFSQQVILSSLQAYCVGILQRLLSWADGFFQFESGIFPPIDKITVRVGLENIILEGTRRLQEWEFLQDEIPDLEMAIKFTDRPYTDISNLHLTRQEWSVINYIDPRNSLQKISRATNLNDLEIRRIVYSLLEAGVVELVRPLKSRNLNQPSDPSQPPMTINQKEERKSLIARIIDRIRSL